MEIEEKTPRRDDDMQPDDWSEPDSPHGDELLLLPDVASQMRQAAAPCPSVAAVPNPVSLALYNADRGMLVREDGRKVRVATMMTKKMFEARSTGRAMSVEEKQAETARLHHAYLEEYGIRDAKTGEMRFPDYSNPEDLRAISEQHNVTIYNEKPQEKPFQMEKDGYFRYPRQLRKTLNPGGELRIPIDIQTHAIATELERASLATSFCLMPLINIVVPVSYMLALLIDKPWPYCMDSFDMLSAYRVCFLILTSGFHMAIEPDASFLTDERMREIDANDAAHSITWPEMEQAIMSESRTDVPTWFMDVMRWALQADKAMHQSHFLSALKKPHNEKIRDLLLGATPCDTSDDSCTSPAPASAPPDDNAVEHLLISWAASSMYDQIGVTLLTLSRACAKAFQTCGCTETNMTLPYLRELHLKMETATFELLTTYDLAFLRILARYIPCSQWPNFAPRYQRVPPSMIRQGQITLTVSQRTQILKRRFMFFKGVPDIIARSDARDWVVPNDPSSPTWADLTQLHIFMNYTPAQDSELQDAIAAIEKSVGALSIKWDDAKSTADPKPPKRQREHQREPAAPGASDPASDPASSSS